MHVCSLKSISAEAIRGANKLSIVRFSRGSGLNSARTKEMFKGKGAAEPVQRGEVKQQLRSGKNVRTRNNGVKKLESDYTFSNNKF